LVSTPTFGNVILEAQACGVPVIVTDSGGPCENIIENETGIIYKDVNIDGLIKCVEKMLNKNLIKKMSHNCIKYMENRSFDSGFLET
jgi:glycosyltransferase involved in cell wall biosynthesis